jgi:hypothetical protein
MSDQGSSVPARWAADPSGRHRFRYWDGATWTGHVFDGETPPVAAPGPPPTTSLPPLPESIAQRGPGQDLAQPDDDDATAADELDGAHRRRQPPRSRGPFWIGVLVGGVVVGIAAAIAWVTVGDNSDTTTVATPTTSTTSQPRATTTTLAPSTSVTTTTVPSGRPPAQVRVLVLNASGTAGAAGAKSDALRASGYMIAGVGDATPQQGTTVACKPGFDAEATALAEAVGAGATTKPFPSPPPAGSTDADCVVTLGS